MKTQVTKVVVNVRMSPHKMQILTKAEFPHQALLVVTREIRQDFTKIRLREPSCSTRTERQTDRCDESNTLLGDILYTSISDWNILFIPQSIAICEGHSAIMLSVSINNM
jgi:hypothetical protein